MEYCTEIDCSEQLPCPIHVKSKSKESKRPENIPATSKASKRQEPATTTPTTTLSTATTTTAAATTPVISDAAAAIPLALVEPCPARLEDCEQMVLPNPAKWVLQGHSRAGERTGFWLSPIKIVLDAGLTTWKLPNAIFITHPHVDHSWMLPWIFGCRTPLLTDEDCKGLGGRPVYAPRSAWPMLEQLQRACVDLSHGKLGAESLGSRINDAQKAHAFKCEAPRKDGSLGVCVTCPCDEGKLGNGYDDRSLTPGNDSTDEQSVTVNNTDTHTANATHTADTTTSTSTSPLLFIADSSTSASSSSSSSSSSSTSWNTVPGSKGLKVEYLPCYHTAETVGFGFATVSSRLKPEYQGTAGKKLGELRKSGVEVSENTMVPQLAFYGDTNVDALRNHTQWEKYPVVVIECTLYPSLGKSEEVALHMGHIHWSSISPIIQSHPSTFFVLIHHSLAMRMRDLTDFETEVKTKQGFSNFVLWKG